MYKNHIVYKNVKDFNDEQISIIATRYANTPYNWTSWAIASEFSRDGEYTIRPRTISSLIQKAIKNAIVNEETAKKIKRKAIYNASLRSKYYAEKVCDKYNLLLKERLEFIENGYKRPRKVKIKEQKETESEFVTRMKKQIQYLKDQISFLQHQIDTFDYYSTYDISLTKLKEDLEKAKKELKEIKMYNRL